MAWELRAGVWRQTAKTVNLLKSWFPPLNLRVIIDLDCFRVELYRVQKDQCLAYRKYAIYVIHCHSYSLVTLVV